MNNQKWSDTELRAAVETYMAMLDLERLNHSYSKTDFRNELLNGPLSNRTRRSIELRMQNISAFREEKGWDWINGYKPMSHIGERVKSKLAIIFDDIQSSN